MTGPGRRGRGTAVGAVLVLVLLTVTGTLGSSIAAAVPRETVSGSGGPAPRYDCAFNFVTDAFTGAEATASAIGWEGNQLGVVTCLGGTFVAPERSLTSEGFGIYDGSPTRWSDLDGYLPAQLTSFAHGRAQVTITEFADRVAIDGDAYVLVYARVAVTDPTDRAVDADPRPSPDLVALNAAPTRVPPRSTVEHDYVMAVDRFGNSYPWPAPAALAAAGGFDEHLADMRSFWEGQLASIAQVRVPDAGLDDAYRAGFIETQIARSGDRLDTGVNGYQQEYSHDVIGILTNLFSQGFYADAHALLLEARHVMGQPGQYVDGLWTYALPWAVYLLKTGDEQFVRENLTAEGPGGPADPSIEDTAHQIAADRTGPDGTMEATDDIDTQGYWTVDDEEALVGLAAYAFVARQVGVPAEAAWATAQYRSLLAATDAELARTIRAGHLDYLPCSLLQSDAANRCHNPEDANWASTLGVWAWDAQLFGLPFDGPLASLIDDTYAFGFGRLHGLLPADTFGGYPGDYYSSAYNAVYGTAGLVGGPRYRDQGIRSYQFMLTHSQSGPRSWWESSSAPSSTGPWIGPHPTSGQGASPHAWGMAGADKVLLDSLVTQSADGTLVVGRGVPDAWLGAGTVRVDNFPTVAGARVGVSITASGRSVVVTFSGERPSRRTLIELPAFVDNISSVSAGRADDRSGTVRLPAGTTGVTVVLRHAVH